MKVLSCANGISFGCMGPDLYAKARGTVFYFALSASETLLKDPFNQPVQHLVNAGIRVLSVSLPFHEPPFVAKEAIGIWAESYHAGKDPLRPFFTDVAIAMQSLSLEWEHVAIMGLSRGAFVGGHILQKIPQIPLFLGFAPMTMLSQSEEFAGMDPGLDLSLVSSDLATRRIRLYIGNNDRKVGTERCISFVMQTVKIAAESKLRAIPIELMIGISVGLQGHGTSPATFSHGVNWLLEHL